MILRHLASEARGQRPALPRYRRDAREPERRALLVVIVRAWSAQYAPNTFTVHYILRSESE